MSDRGDLELAAAQPADAQSVAPLASHFPVLDGLRGVAILLVLIHMLNLLGPMDGFAAHLSSHISSVGWTGVQLFFVLSGFLITGILLDTQRATNYFSAFYMRRTLRIFPLYFGVLLAAFVVLPALGIVPAGIAADRKNQFWLWTYLENWAIIFDAGSTVFPHFWSLAVEEQFYLLWPLLIHTRSPRQCLRFCLYIAAAGLALRFVLAWLGTPDGVIYQNSFCRMDALALGAAAAAAFRVPEYRQWIYGRHMHILAASILLTIVGTAVTRGFWNDTFVGETVGYTIVALIFVMLIIAAVGAEAVAASGWVTVLRWRPLRVLGKYSYAMYVFHKLLHDHMGKPLVAALDFNAAGSIWRNVAYVGTGVLVTFAVAFVSWHIYEKHFLRMKRFYAAKL